MKFTTFLVLCFIIINSLHSQNTQRNVKTLTQEQYRLYFPIETQLSQFIPTTDYVCILPSNETNKELQAEVNEFYKNSFIRLLPTIPNQVSRVITDKQALQEDLSNINIYAFGTVKGNLWISEFIEKAKDFPIKITNDSIIAGDVYRGTDFIVTALWYNPVNYKHSVFLYVPQQLEVAQKFKKINLPQLSIWQDGKQIPCMNFYNLRNNHWSVSGQRDTMLDFRSARNNNLYPNPFVEIERFYYRYPSLAELSICRIDGKDVTIDAIKISDINKDFSNLDDMDWLRPVLKDNKVLAVGESHHLKFNGYILRRILFAANTFDYYPTLVLELPYSYTGYFNHYLNLEDDELANAYCDSVLTKMHKGSIPTFIAIRSWNKQHKDKRIGVGCSDIEHSFWFTVNYILKPYFIKIKPGTDLKLDDNADNLVSYLEQGQSLIDEARKHHLSGEYSFQTPDYMESVLENLKSSIPIKMDPKKFTDHTERYKVMIRNVTDDRFLGKKVTFGKSLFYGGSEHFRILNDGKDIKGIKTEGYYLAHSFKPTIGKVYSIWLNTKAVSIEDSIQRIDPNLRFTTETTLIRLYKQGKIKLNEPVLGYTFSEIDRFIYRLSYKYPNSVFRINKIDTNRLLNKYEGVGRYMEFQNLKIPRDFNTQIIIPYSPVGD